MRRGTPPAWRQVGGCKTRSVLELSLAPFLERNGGYDFAQFDRVVSELLDMMEAGTLIRFYVGTTLPCVDFPPPFGPEHLVELIGPEPYVLHVWEELLAGGEPDGGAVA